MFPLIVLLVVMVFYLGLVVVLARSILSGIFVTMRRAAEARTSEPAALESVNFGAPALLRGTSHEDTCHR